MRLRISHSTTYEYDPPATGVIQVLRMTPGNHDGQYVANWQVDVSVDARLDIHSLAWAADGDAVALNDIVRVQLKTQQPLVADAYRANRKLLGNIFRDYFGDYYPAMALFEVSNFYQDEALIEMEGLAMIHET